MCSPHVKSDLLSNLQWIVKEESIMEIEGGGSQFNRRYTIQPVGNQVLYLFSDELVRAGSSPRGDRKSVV